MLGYAFMGKAHSNAYSRMPVFFYPPPAVPRLVAICGRSRGEVSEAARRYGYERFYTDWRRLVSDEEVEVVDNGLPNHVHKEPTVAAAEAGKHVLCEKPLGMDGREAGEMVRAVRKAGVKNMVAHNYRFVPAIQLAKRLIEEGRVGKVVEYRASYLQDWLIDPASPVTWRLRRRTAGSGALGDLGSHIVDLGRFLVGEMESTVALKKTFVQERPSSSGGRRKKKEKVDVDDAFIALVRFRGGQIGSLEASRFCAGMKNFARVEVHGTEGTVAFNLERLNELQLYSSSDPASERGFRPIMVTEPTHPFGGVWWPPGHTLGWEHAAVHMVHHFFRSIVEDTAVEPLGATFSDGLAVNNVLDSIDRSATSGRWEKVPLSG